jgi:hypothetical protein
MGRDTWLDKALASWDARKTADRLQAGVVVVSLLVLAFGWFVCRALGNSVSDDSSVSLGVCLTAFTVFTAAAVVGASLGFLFGLPRPQEESPGGSEPGRAAISKPYYLPNSNLVKVSDWVTTIVVGLTLVNLGNIEPGISQLAEVLSEPLGSAVHSGTVGVALVLIGVLVGFVSCYLWTTVQVRTLLIRSEEERDKAKVRVQAYEQEVKAKLGNPAA